MSPGRYDLDIYAGDDWSRQLTFQATGGTALALPTTGWAAQIRTSRAATAAVPITVDASSAAVGIIRLSLPPSVTADLQSGVWDLQCSSGGTRTYVQGTVTVTRDVTRV